jgi:hypothetical protein
VTVSQTEGEVSPVGIGGIDFRGSSTPAATDRPFLSRPFSPAAQRLVFAMMLSKHWTSVRPRLILAAIIRSSA